MFSMQDLSHGYDFFTGVPDSKLKSFIKEIEVSGFKHIPALNEGQAIGIAVGAELAGMKSCVYLQNSGIGNCINALTSLTIQKSWEINLEKLTQAISKKMFKKIKCLLIH